MNKYIEYRREFHHYPEIGWTEIRTSARVAEILDKIGYRCKMGLEVLDEATISFETLDEERRKKEKARAVEQGADPAYVERTDGFPGVMAELDTGIEGPVTAFRFDIDCLPYQEPKRRFSTFR